MAAAENSVCDRAAGRQPIVSIVAYADLPLRSAVDRYVGRIEHLMMADDFCRGFARLAPAGLTFDAWLLRP